MKFKNKKQNKKKAEQKKKTKNTANEMVIVFKAKYCLTIIINIKWVKCWRIETNLE